MATTKEFSDPEIGLFTVRKRKNARRVTLSISKKGIPNVTIPSYLPFAAGVTFLTSHRQWIEDHSPKTQPLEAGREYQLYDGTLVSIRQSYQVTRNSTRHSFGRIDIIVRDSQDDSAYIERVIKKYLAQDCENAVHPRIANFSRLLRVTPRAVRFRATTSRWGSCNSKHELTFSVYMAQLPNELIDYVVIHELAHIRQLNHSPQFWQLVASADPNYKQHRKELKEYELRAFAQSF